MRLLRSTLHWRGHARGSGSESWDQAQRGRRHDRRSRRGGGRLNANHGGDRDGTTSGYGVYDQ